MAGMDDRKSRGHTSDSERSEKMITSGKLEFIVRRPGVDCWCLTLTLILLGASPAVFAQPADEANAQGKAKRQQAVVYNAVIVQLADVELKRMKLLLEITNEEAASLKESAVEHSAEVAKIMAVRAPFKDFVQLNELPDEMKAKLSASLKSLVGDRRWAAYEEDLRLRESLMNETGQMGLLAALDRLFAFSSEQQKAIASLLAKSWQPRWNMNLLLFVNDRESIGSISEVLKQLPEQELTRVFRRGQMAVIKELGDKDTPQMVSLRYLATEPDNDAWQEWQQGFRLHSQRLVRLKIDELTELCDLDDRQVRILSTAGKGASAALARKIADALESVQQDRNLLNEGKRRELLLGDFGDQLWNEARWQKAIDKVLIEVGRQKYESRQAERAKLSHESLVLALILSWHDALNLTGRQYQELATALFDTTQAHKSESIYDQTIRLLTVPEETFRRILNVDQWQQLDQLRQELEKQVQ